MLGPWVAAARALQPKWKLIGNFRQHAPGQPAAVCFQDTLVMASVAEATFCNQHGAHRSTFRVSARCLMCSCFPGLTSAEPLSSTLAPYHLKTVPASIFGSSGARLPVAAVPQPLGVEIPAWNQQPIGLCNDIRLAWQPHCIIPSCVGWRVHRTARCCP